MSKTLATIGRRTNLLYCLALLVEVALFHRRVLFSSAYVFPWDFRGVHLPLATFIADSLAHGQFPLWDPYTYCGSPIFANIQAALFYPPALAAALMSNWLGGETLLRLLTVAAVLQMWFAGICTFALLRRLGAQPGAAWLAATVYELGCFFASQAQHMGAVHGASWLPLAWLCVVELRDGLRWRWLAGLSLALALTVFAGLPQVAVAAFGSVLALAVMLAAFRLARRALPLRVLAAWIWALALTAVQLIPTAELTRYSVAKYRAEWLKSGGGIHWQALYSLVSPNHWNVFDLSKFHGPGDPTFLYLYCSLLGLGLAMAVAAWKPDRWSRAFSLLTLSATVWMLGDSTPFGRAIFEALPVSVRIGIHPEFTMPVFALGLAVLAGLGANRFLPHPRLQLLAGAVVAIDLLAVSSGRPFNTMKLAVEPGMTRNTIEGSRELSTRLHALTSTAVPPYRIDTADASISFSNSAPLYGIPTANGCDPMAPERMIQVRLAFSPGPRWGACYQVVNADSPVLGLINVRYLISRAPVRAAVFQPVGETAGYRIFENTRTSPRYFLLRRVQVVGGLREAAAVLRAPGFDPTRTAIVEAPAGPFPAVPVDASGSVDVLSYAPSAVDLRTHSQTAALLVATDAWYPGWEATLDGRPAPLYVTDVAFRGIPIPAGEHRVGMRFAPRILYRSAPVSLLALLAAVVALAAGRRKPPLTV